MGSGPLSRYGIKAADPRDVPANQVRRLLVVSDSSIAKADDRLAALIAGSMPIDEVGHSVMTYRRPVARGSICWRKGLAALCVTARWRPGAGP